MICLQHFLLSPEWQQSLFSINLIGDVYSAMDYKAEFSLKFEITLDTIQEMNKEQLFFYKRGLALHKCSLYLAHFPTLVHSERIQNREENNWIWAISLTISISAK